MIFMYNVKRTAFDDNLQLYADSVSIRMYRHGRERRKII